jgi:hypothetical protein
MLKKPIIIALLATLLFALLLLFVRPKPQPPITQSPSDSGLPTLPESVNISFSGEKPELPSDIPQLSVDRPSLDAYAQTIAASAGFSQKTPGGNLWLSPERVESLNVTAYSLIYSRFGPFPEPEPQAVDATSLVTSAQMQLRRLGITHYQVSANSAEFFVGTHEPTQSTPQQAQLVTFALEQTYNSFAVRDLTQHQQVGRIWVRADGIVSKIEFNPPATINASEESVQPLLSIDDALSRIKQGDGQVTQQSTPGSYELIDLLSYTVIEFESVALELRIAPGEIVEPYYVFVGKGYLGGKLVTQNIEVIVKATK